MSQTAVSSEEISLPEDISGEGHLQLVTEEAPLPAPKKKKSRWALWLAAALGGGTLFGAAVGLAALVLLMLTGGAAAWWFLSVDEAAITEAEEVAAEVLAEAEALDAEALDAEAASTTGADGTADAVVTTPAPRTSTRRSSPAPVVEVATIQPPADDPPPPGMATMKIITNPPAATIYVDGTSAGRTPLKYAVTQGSHDVRLVSGKADETLTLTITSDSKHCFDIKGKKVTASGC